MLRRGPRSRGQAVVEFAVILPVFLLITLGVVDMARVFTAYIALTNGVSNAAIYAGQGGYLNKWCSPSPQAVGDLPCPAPGHTSTNPDNIAYQIKVEATGLNSQAIVMQAPVCTLIASGTVVDCTSIDPKNVRIVASYNIDLITPLMTTLMGGPVHMTAATTAAIQ